MRPFSFDSKKTLTEGGGNKTAAERGAARLVGTPFTSFHTINLREKMKDSLRLSLLRVAWQNRCLKAHTWVLSVPGDTGSSGVMGRAALCPAGVCSWVWRRSRLENPGGTHQ